MPTIYERLRQAGIRVAAASERADVRSECARVGRILRQRKLRVIGVVPAAKDVAIPAVAIQIGIALADVTGSPVGIVDAYGSWPGVRALGEAAGADAALFVTSWLQDNVALLTPRSFDVGAMLPTLAAALHGEAAVFNHLVVDLTGFDRLGEHLAAMATMDGVIVVARSGRTRIEDLERWMRDIPAEHNLGVLLTGM